MDIWDLEALESFHESIRCIVVHVVLALGQKQLEGKFTTHGCFVKKVLGICDEAFTKHDE